ncbi:hypothetical protein BO443_50273 [Burkholderia orbicola]
MSVMRYSDNDERGHDPTPCSSSVCNGGGTTRRSGAAMPGFAWRIPAQRPDDMREDSYGSIGTTWAGAGF